MSAFVLWGKRLMLLGLLGQPCFYLYEAPPKPRAVTHACGHRDLGAEAGGLQDPGRPQQLSKTLSQNEKQKGLGVAQW